MSTQRNYFSVVCNTPTCGGLTSRVYARKHDGKCKKCVTGIVSPHAATMKTNYRNLCPTCGERTLTAYQKQNGYHCDGCASDADPLGAYKEMFFHNDDQGDY